MMQSHRSPRQQISRSRAKPYARRPPPARSASIMSTIKNIVTAPLSWFAANEEFEDTPGKRRRALPRDGLQQESRTVKRQRHRSPSPLPNQGYLDPPQLLLQSPAKPDSRSQGQNQPTAFSPSVSINIPSNPQQQHLGRHAYLPIPTTYSQHNLPRTMSMDPPQLTREATTVPLPHSREHSIASLSHDHSIGPTRTSFRMRTTLSPVPSGNEFGPKPQRRERDPSEPPPLTALMSNPIFVKPPPDVHPIQRSLSAQPTITLGSLAQAHRPTRSPLRHSSGLLFGSQISSSSSDLPSRPVNASEIALSELAVYRTPLLPTRLRGSAAIPDMFKPKKVHQIVPMRKGKDELPRLGTGEKAKKDESGKPYSGQGGMKKLLARRKLEAEEEKKKQKSEAMTDDSFEDELKAPKASEHSKSLDDPVPDPVVESRAQQHPVNTRQASSLRVGRTKVRQHAEPTRPTKARFSAAYEEDDSMDQQEDGDEAPKPVPIFEPPKGFSFAKETTPAPTPAAVKDAKEPPISALPFSLTKSAPMQDSTVKAPSPHFPPSPAPSQSTFSFLPVAPATPAAQIPAVSLTPPTPQTASKPSDVSAPAPTIPNFFSNSPLLTKSASAPPTPPITNLFGSPPVPEKSRSAVPEARSLFGNDAASSAPAASLFGTAVAPSSAGTSLFGSPPLIPAVSKTEDKPPVSGPLFGSTPTTSNAIPTVPSTSLFVRAESKALPEQSSTLTPSGSLFGGFGTSKMEPAVATAPASNEIAKPPSPFGETGATTFGGFGSKPISEAPKQGLKPTMTLEQPPATPIIVKEPSKPLFGPGPITNSDTKDAAKAPFTFGFGNAPPQDSPSKFKFNSTSATPPVEKPSTLFVGAPAPVPASASAAASSPMFSFGATSTAATDSSKSFFGNSTARPATPPKADQEERMEESPTRSMDTSDKPTTSDFFASRALNFNQNGGGGAATPFTFGTSTTSSNPFASKPTDKPEQGLASGGFRFGSSNGGGFGFGQKEPEPSQPSFPSSSSFTFGKSGESTQRTSSTSPFAFGTQKLPEINTNAPPAGFGFAQKPPASSQGAGSFSFGQPSPASATASFTFGSNQGTAATSFGQPNASAPSSPSTFNQPSPFGFVNSTTPSTAPPNPFFQPSSPVTNPTPGGAFSFGQPTTPQPQSPVTPFSAPTSPQTAGGALFTIGAAPSNLPAGTRQIKKLPTRRRGKP